MQIVGFLMTRLIFILQVHDILHFLPSTNENEIVFLWASEKSGFRHLYHVTSTLSQQPTIEDQDDFFETHKGLYVLIKN